MCNSISNMGTLPTGTCHYSKNQVFGGVTLRDMSLNEMCFCSQLYSNLILSIKCKYIPNNCYFSSSNVLDSKSIGRCLCRTRYNAWMPFWGFSSLNKLLGKRRRPHLGIRWAYVVTHVFSRGDYLVWHTYPLFIFPENFKKTKSWLQNFTKDKK